MHLPNKHVKKLITIPIKIVDQTITSRYSFLKKHMLLHTFTCMWVQVEMCEN